MFGGRWWCWLLNLVLAVGVGCWLLVLVVGVGCRRLRLFFRDNRVTCAPNYIIIVSIFEKEIGRCDADINDAALNKQAL